jgi:F1F0 ATPase subunit 2
MSLAVSSTVFLLTGLCLGAIFFGGLWLTVRALPTARYPTFLSIASFWGRTALVVAAFAFVFSRGWESALICVAGFFLARLLMSRCVSHDGVTGRTAE